MNLDKRNSYTSKSILSILQTTNIVHHQSKSSSIQYMIPSSILIIFSIISIWAIIFYLILGFCYYFQSGILIEDLNLIDNNQEISKQFSQLSFHCFFSVCIYLVLLFICILFYNIEKKNKIFSYQDPK
jgi:hypothetical protein